MNQGHLAEETDRKPSHTTSTVTHHPSINVPNQSTETMTIDERDSRSARDMPRQCHVISQKNRTEWDEAIAAVDDSTRFLCVEWTKLLEQTYGYSPRLVVLHEDKTITGVLPFVIVQSIVTGTRAISLPFFDICHAYMEDKSKIQLLFETLRAHGKKQGWDYLELRGDIKSLENGEPSLSFYNHVVDISKGPEKVFNTMASSTRRAIRKAEKSGVKIEFSDSIEAMKGFYRLQCITRKRHGLPPQPFRFFANIHQNIIKNGSGVIVSAYAPDGQLAASSVYLVQGGIVHYKYGASDKDFQNARVNNLVMWSALEHYSKLGFAELHLGRNSLENQGLRRYKLSYGAVENITHYQRYDLKTDTTTKMTDDVYGWHNKIFATLPIPLARLAGEILYKHIA